MAKASILSKQSIAIIILVILVGISFGYIGIGEYYKIVYQDQVSVYTQGFNDGASQAILQIMNQATTCQPVPLYAGNFTMNLIAVECLQAAQGG